MDPYCPIKTQVLGTYAATLNQVDVNANNNKFYIVQVIDDSPRFHVFTRYGRVGQKGVSGLKSFTSQNTAISKFNEVYKSKTGNTWGQPFVKKSGKYMLMDLEDEGVEDQTSTPAPTTSTPAPTTSAPTTPELDPRILKIVKLIGNKLMMQQTMRNLDVDVQRLPLGKISKSQIQVAHDLLNKITDKLSGLAVMTGTDIADLTSQFWTIVPFNSGRNRPPLLDSKEQIQTCSALLETLENIQIAGSILQRSKTELDIYRSLGVELVPLEDNGSEFNMIQDYVKNSHGSTHTYKLDIASAYAVKQSQDPEFNNIPNHALLFHGSRMANFMGILSEGLRIPQSSQVANGSILGAGIYFADVVTKSFNYTCFQETNDTGIMVLCEVALGESEKVFGPTSDPLPTRCHSRMAIGKSCPSSAQEHNGVRIPNGKIEPNVEGLNLGSSFLYNEFVIYNKNQYKFRYLIELKAKRN